MAKALFTTLLLMCWTQIGFTQVICSPEDTAAFHNKIAQIKNLQANTFGDSLIQVAKTFLGTPYVEKTLEIGTKESLVINLRGLDCTTYVENALAFSSLLKQNKNSFEDFALTLKTIRYRDGILDGYPSRLHYFTDWIRNNSEKGLVKDITSELGGEIVEKSINFMGTHRDLYPFLKDEANYQQMLQVEAKLAEEKLCVLPQAVIASVEEKLENGDIIALATSIGGLDVTHTGFAIRMPNGRIHLLHASITGEVTITEAPLVDYLKRVKKNTGIIVARPL